MRKSTFAALVSASALVAGVEVAAADMQLFATQADFGGSQFAPGGSQPQPTPYRIVTNSNPVPPGQIKQTNYLGLGLYDSSSTEADGGTVAPETGQMATPLTYPASSLGGLNFTSNGLANFDNYNPASGTGNAPDANLGTSYAGLTSPTGSVVVNGYTGGYDTISTGEMIATLPGTTTESPASAAFINALTTGKCLAYDITAPGGGTTQSATYYETTFETQDSNGGFNSTGAMQVNPTARLWSKNTNEYYAVAPFSNLTVGNDDPGSFAVINGVGASSYYTVYVPYSFAANYAATLTYLQFALELNSGGDQIGNVTISNIRTVSPTWAASGSGLSWNTQGIVNYNNPDSAPYGTPANGVLTQQGNWVGAGSNGYGTPNGSGQSATFGDLETGNATVGLDTNQTLGTLNFNTSLYQYNLAPSSTGSSTSGSLIMDNTANSAPAAINDIAGGTSSTNYTEYITAPITLNSNTIVTISRATDILQISPNLPSGNISGTGGLTLAGAGTLLLYGSNSYTGGTTVNGGTLLLGGGSSLPANKPVTVHGGLLEFSSNFAGSSVTLSTLSITGGEVQLGPGVTAGSQSANPPVTAPTSNVNITSLSITGTGKLDLGNNHIIINYGSGPDPIASIAAWIATDYNGGTWNGVGIDSSAAAANDAVPSNPKYGIGYADYSPTYNPAGLSSGQIEIMYTLYGDANLDGKVNGTDFNILASNFNTGGDSWDQGDFNYDGKVNGSDFNLLATNFNQGASQSADPAAVESFVANNGLSADVPEPASGGMMLLGVLGAFSNRHRKAKVKERAHPEFPAGQLESAHAICARRIR